MTDQHSERTSPRRGLVGRMLGERYRITRVVSSGSSTIVADAEDVETRGPVTVKLVRPEWSESAEFQDRFRQTMRMVAKLSHPNVAAILDWGQDVVGKRTTMYAVTEYLGGGSLRDLFDRGRYLDPSQALLVGLEACRGLDYAHRKGLVHSELTPAKLVFGDDRRLRIVDFGLARLLGRQDWTDPSSVATHVARYASPEQATGEPTDGRSDVYSLALVLVEAVSRRVPFAEGSTTATLSARVGRLMPVSADLGPLASVLERAGRPVAADRSTAAELGRGLVRAAEKLPRPNPIPILITERFEDTSTLRRPNDPTGGVRRPTPEPGVALVPPPTPPGADELAPGAPDVASPPVPADGPDDPAVSAPAAPAEPPSATSPVDHGDVTDLAPSDPAPITSPTAAITDEGPLRDEVVEALAAPSATTATPPDPGTSDAAVEGASQVAVGDQTEPPAALDPGPAGTATSDTASVDPGSVEAVTGPVDLEPTAVDASPVVTAAADAPSDLAVSTASGPVDAEPADTAPRLPPPHVPERAALYDGDADVTKDELATLARTPAPTDGGMDRPRARPSDDGPTAAGVATTDPATPPTAARRGSATTPAAAAPPTATTGRRDRDGRSPYLIALGGFLVLAALAGLAFVAYLLFRVPRHEVPALAGLDADRAQTLIADFDWDVQITRARSDDEPDVGQVIRTNPEEGEDLAEGEPFQIVVSEGPEFRSLPDLAGLTRGAAETALAELRLVAVPGETAFSEDVPVGEVISWTVPSDPELVAGGQVLPETEVEFVVSKGPEPRTLPDLVGLTVEDATAALEDLRIGINVSEPVFDNDIPAGSVVAANPAAGATVERDSTVTVTPSKGPDLVAVPDLTGQTLGEARVTLAEAGLQVGALLGNSSTGTVVQASVAGDVVEAGDEFLRYTAVDLALI